MSSLPDKNERLAQRFHEVYEELAPLYGWETQPKSRVAWADLPSEQRGLMIETVKTVLSAIGATASPDGPVYLVNGKPCRRCTCPKLEGKCPLGIKRTDATTELSFCLIPVNDVLLVGGR